MLDARPVDGRFRRLRSGADVALIAVLVATPWIRVGGHPLVLLDIPARKFHVLGLVIFPQELFFLWLIVAGLALTLFLVTALLGRLWCGWACPQTVFTDVFAMIARRIQGWRGASRPRHVARWRKVATHAVWLLLSMAIGFHLVAYFRSPYDMVSQAQAGTLSGPSLGFLVVAGLLSYFDFAIVRQTFCKWMCPYARFQGVLFDRDTLVVGYDARRGEPRGKRRADGGDADERGDCVDCGLCVAVCPTGIDIRQGLQLECIACTQCIDACDGVMDRIGRARNLIGYRSLVSLEGVRRARLLRPRVVVYGALLAVVAATFAALLDTRLPMDLQVAHNREALYTKVADGRVGNSFTLHVQNREPHDRSYRIGLDDDENFELVAGVNPVHVEGTSALETRVFVVARADSPPPSQEIRFVLEDESDAKHRIVRATRFLAPSAAHVP